MTPSYIFDNCSDTPQIKNTSYEITPVRSKEDLKKFYQVSFQVYKGNPNWVAPFWKEFRAFFETSNPFWTHAEAQLYYIEKDGQLLGRIAAIIDHTFCENVGEQIGYFGFFECINDSKISTLLWDQATAWLSSKTMTKMRGPIDGRIDKGCGFLAKGFDTPASILSTYSHSYYLDLAEQYKLSKIRDFILYTIDLTIPISKKLEEKARTCLTSDITFRPFHRLKTNQELEWWIPLFLESFSNHWGYVPVSPDEVRERFGVKQLRWIVDQSLFLIAEDNHTPVAFIWSTPEFNQLFRQMEGKLGIRQLLYYFRKKQTITTGKMHFIGIKKGYGQRNIGSCLNYLTLKEMKQRGYTHCEVGVIDEGNTIAHTTIAITGAKPYKKYRVFEKQLTATKDQV